MRLGSLFHGLPETPFEEQTDRILEDEAGLVTLAAHAEIAHPLRQTEGGGQNAQHRIESQEQAEQGDDEEIERDLGTPGRHDQEQITVRVNPENYEAVLAARLQLQASLTRDNALTVAADSSLAQGDCVLETPYGKVDARIDTQLELVKTALKELIP